MSAPANGRTCVDPEQFTAPLPTISNLWIDGIYKYSRLFTYRTIPPSPAAARHMCADSAHLWLARGGRLLTCILML